MKRTCIKKLGKEQNHTMKNKMLVYYKKKFELSFPITATVGL